MGDAISIQGDAYSFGILVLEIFTGQRPTDAEAFKDDNTNLNKLVKNALPNKVMEIIDPKILLEHDAISTNNRINNLIGSILGIGVCLFNRITK